MNMSTTKAEQGLNDSGAQSERRIYVACLAAYNAGTLHGEWIDADQDAEDIHAAVQEMLKRSPEPGAEEWAIHDYEGFGPIKLSESESFVTVAALAKAIEEHGEIFAHFYQDQNSDVEQALSDFSDNYNGEWDSLADYVENYWEDCGEFKGDEKTWWHPTNYIDWERMAKDLELSGDVFTIEHDGKVHVFNNH